MAYVNLITQVWLLYFSRVFHHSTTYVKFAIIRKGEVSRFDRMRLGHISAKGSGYESHHCVY